MKNFDDLFNEFFNRKKTNINPNVGLGIKKIIEALTNFKTLNQEEELEKLMNNQLGEPDEIIDHIEEGFLFKKLVWHTAHGDFIKVIISEVLPEQSETKKPNKSLEEQLKDALEVEDYELAIKLRDQINGTKKTKKTKK